MDCTEVLQAERAYIGLAAVIATLQRELLLSPGTTPAHDNDVRILQRSLAMLTRRYGDISIVIGGKDPEEKKKKHGHGPPPML